MAVTHSTIKAPGQGLFAVADWNASHIIDGSTGEILFREAGGTIGTDANLFWDDGNKRLGIGTSSPQRKLHIDSPDWLSHFQISRSGEKWDLSISGDDLIFVDNDGNTNVTFTDEGHVGIGTITPAGTLDVQDGTGSQTAGDLLVDGAAHIVYVGQLDAAAGNTIFRVRDRIGGIKLEVASASAAHSYFSNFGAGFGLGVGLAVPTARLHVLNTAATGIPAAYIVNQDVDEIALDILASNTTADVINITANTLTTAIGLDVYSNSAAFTSTAGLARVYLDNVGASGTAMTIRNDGTGHGLIVDGGNVGIGTTGPASKLQVAGAISSATLTHSAVGPIDNLNVAGVNTVFVDSAGNNVTIGGFAGGVDGQVLYVVRISNVNNVTIEHNEGGATQPILLHRGADETLDAHFGGWQFICHGGTDWHDVSHARHV